MILMRRLALLLLLLPSALALAAEGVDPAAVSTVDHPEEPPLLLPLDGPGAEQVRQRWEECVGFMKLHKYSNLLVGLDLLKQAQIDAGVANLPALSAALTEHARRLAANGEGDFETALTLLKHAQLLSPDVPDFFFARANLLWQIDKGLIGETFSEFTRGLRVAANHLPTLHGVLLGGLGIAWLAGFLVMTLFSLMLLFRHLSLFSHDLGHLLWRGLSPLQLRAIGLAVLLGPMVLDLGIVPLFALWWVALWVYQSRTEKVLTVGLVLFIYLWPLGNMSAQGSLGFADGPAERAWSCHNGDCPRLRMHQLARDVAAGGDDGAALLALASAWHRAAGTSASAWKEAEALLIQNEAEATQPAADVLLGSLLMIRGMERCNRHQGNVDAGIDDFQRAAEHYRRALAADRSSWQAAFNLARTLEVIDPGNDESNGLIQEAQAIAPLAVNHHQERSGHDQSARCREDFSAHRELAQPDLGLSLLAAAGLESGRLSGDHSRLPALHDLLLGPLEVWMLALLATVVLALAILMTIATRWFRPSFRCIKCHAIGCLKCRPELTGTGLCNQCIFYRIRANHVDPKETWLREKGIENRIRGRHQAAALLTFVLPGSGHFLRGRPLRGAIFMGLFSLAVGAIFLFPTVFSLVSPPLSPLAVGSVIPVVLWSVVAFVSYFLSLLDIYSGS